MLCAVRRAAIWLAIGMSATLAATAARAAFPGALYETFGDGGVAALDLADPTLALGFLDSNATNIVAGDSGVYFQDGTAIYASGPTLVGATLVHENNFVPTNLALDAADGILYESFGADGVGAININTGAGIGNLNIAATNMVFGDGTVYIQDGTAIYASSADLVGLTLVHDNNFVPTGLALDAADGILYESFGADGVGAISVNTGAGIQSRHRRDQHGVRRRYSLHPGWDRDLHEQQGPRRADTLPRQQRRADRSRLLARLHAHPRPRAFDPRPDSNGLRWNHPLLLTSGGGASVEEVYWPAAAAMTASTSARRGNGVTAP